MLWRHTHAYIKREEIKSDQIGTKICILFVERKGRKKKHNET